MCVLWKWTWQENRLSVSLIEAFSANFAAALSFCISFSVVFIFRVSHFLRLNCYYLSQSIFFCSLLWFGIFGTYRINTLSIRCECHSVGDFWTWHCWSKLLHSAHFGWPHFGSVIRMKRKIESTSQLLSASDNNNFFSRAIAIFISHSLLFLSFVFIHLISVAISTQRFCQQKSPYKHRTVSMMNESASSSFRFI